MARGCNIHVDNGRADGVPIFSEYEGMIMNVNADVLEQATRTPEQIKARGILITRALKRGDITQGEYDTERKQLEAEAYISIVVLGRPDTKPRNGK